MLTLFAWSAALLADASERDSKACFF